ncbi:hypothetical protein RRG08_059010, partial [Elysia crispata]
SGTSYSSRTDLQTRSSRLPRSTRLGTVNRAFDWLRLRLHPAPRPVPCNSVSSTAD